MKIENKEVNKFIEKITEQQDFKVILIYGEDDSSVIEKYNKIINNFINKNFDIENISNENFRSGFLLEKLTSISMFSKNTLYVIRLFERENDFTKYLEELKNVNTDDVVLITAGGLDTKSSLRKFAEKSPITACIPAYEEANIEVFITTKLKENNFSFNNDIINYIKQNVGNNTLLIRNEIYKLCLYKGNDKNLTLQDVKNCIKDISENTLNDFCNAFCSLNYNETIKVYKKLINENIDIIALIRSLTKYFLQLQKMKKYIENGENIEDVFKYENIFWKQKNIVKIHLSKWTTKSINQILSKLLELEKNIKFNTNKNIYLENFILKIMLIFHKNNNI